jgi:nucleotide-binding universal stress UspA family protein
MPILPSYIPSEDAERIAQVTVEKVRARHPDVDIVIRIVEGHPALVLVERSKEAALLVVGNRGHRELTGLLLGSVSEHCVAHAHCPVLVVRH